LLLGAIIGLISWVLRWKENIKNQFPTRERKATHVTVLSLMKNQMLPS